MLSQSKMIKLSLASGFVPGQGKIGFLAKIKSEDNQNLWRDLHEAHTQFTETKSLEDKITKKYFDSMGKDRNPLWTALFTAESGDDAIAPALGLIANYVVEESEITSKQMDEKNAVIKGLKEQMTEMFEGIDEKNAEIKGLKEQMTEMYKADKQLELLVNAALAEAKQSKEALSEINLEDLHRQIQEGNEEMSRLVEENLKLRKENVEFRKRLE